MIKLKTIASLYAMFFAQFLFSQGIFVGKSSFDGIATITIKHGTNISIKGNLSSGQGNFTAVKNFGQINLSGNLTNQSSGSFFDPDPKAGELNFTGTNASAISGTSAINCFRVNIYKQAGIILSSNLIIRDALNLQNGSVVLDHANIYLPYSNDGVAKLLNESNNNRVYGIGEIIAENIPVGDIQNLGIGVKIDYSNPDMQVNIARGHSIQQHAGDGSISKYLNILGPISGSPTISFAYFDADIPVGSSEQDFKLWYSADNYNYKNIGGEVNSSINSLSYTGDLSIGRYTLSDEMCKKVPGIELGSDLDYCKGSSAVLADKTGTSGGMEHYWLLEGQSAPITSDAITINNFEGKVKLRLTDQNGCFSWDSLMVNQNPVPITNFKAQGQIVQNSSCLGQSMYFTDLSSVEGGGTIKSRLWQFGDGSTSSDQEIGKTYLIPKNYIVRLTDTTNAGCFSSFEKEIEIIPLPQVNYNFSKACLGEPTGFTSTSFDVNGIFQLTWDFGDGSAKEFNTDPASHLYSNYGNYPSKLIVQSSKGCIDSLEQTIEVFPPIKANFTVNDDCQNKQIVFTNESTAENGSITTYDWDFGGLGNSSLKNPTHQFNTDGIYNIKLSVVSNFGCKSEITKPLIVYPVPMSDFIYSHACDGEEVNFDNNSIVTSGFINSQTWFFGDGNTSSSQDAKYTYPSLGTYQAKLQSISDKGCINSITKEITIFEKPHANFYAANVCNRNATNFVNTSSIQNGNLSFAWDFGNGNGSTSQDPSFTFSLPGQYPVLLKVVSSDNCISTVEKMIEVYQNPALDLGGHIATCGNQLTIDAQNPGSSYFWSDNTTNQIHTITKSGNYYIIITNEYGCQHQEDFSVSLQSAFVPNLGNDTTVCGKTILNAYHYGSTYLWNNGQTSNAIEVVQSGNYSVAVTDQNNCVGTDQIALTVNPFPSLELGDNIDACGGNVVSINPVTNANSFLWSDNSTQTVLNVNKPGIYWLKATNNYNCSKYDSVEVHFTPMPLHTLQNASLCSGSVLDAGNAGSSYLWSNGSTVRAQNIDQTGLYWVKIANSEKCYIIDSAMVQVNPVPVIVIPETIEICDGNSATLDASNANSTYNWSTGATTASIQANKAGTYKINVTNDYNCSASKIITMLVNKRPKIDLPEKLILCSNDSANLFAGNDGSSYKWYSNQVLVSEQNNLKVKKPGTYIVTVENNLSCSSTDSILIEQTSFNFNANFLVASEIYAGDTIQFVNLTEPSAEYYLWDFGDGTHSEIENPQHKYYIPNEFKVKLSAKIGQCKDELVKTIDVKRKLKTLKESNNVISENIFGIKEFIVYPNPARDLFYSKIVLTHPENVNLFLFDIQGRLVYKDKLFNMDNYTTSYNLGLNKGLYILKIIARGISKNKKIIIY